MSEEVRPVGETSPPEAPARRAFHFKGFLSLMLSLVFLAVAFSGGILYLTPRGRMANWTDWTILGLQKETWAAVHMNTCLVLLAAAALHLALNWKMFLGYVHKKATGGLNLKREMLAAGGLTALLLVGTIQVWPPFNQLPDLNLRIKNAWEAGMAAAPIPHSEELTLARFAEQIDLPVEMMKSALSQEGYEADDLECTVRELASREGVAPRDLLAAIQKHCPEARGVQGFGQGRGMERGQGGGGGSVSGGCSRFQEGGRGESCASGADCKTDVSQEAAQAGNAGDGSPGESGQGTGWGPGMGMGRGMGRGAGRGMGTGPGHAERQDLK
ncbi:MAG: DUF4405 domain-containing protein [Thermoguttaceae bacterium]